MSVPARREGTSLETIPVPGPADHSAGGRPADRPPSGAASGLLDLDLDVDPSRQLQPLQAVDRLRGRLEDVEEALVDAHLEVLAAVLVLVRGPDDRVPVLVRGQG